MVNKNTEKIYVNDENMYQKVKVIADKKNVKVELIKAANIFEKFGFVSGRNVDKFENMTPNRSDNGLAFLPRYINSFMSLKVEKYIDFDTHGMFVCSISELRVLNNLETMTYTYYQNNVKPKPKTEGKKGFVCKICGYVLESDTLPDDFICPLCKHGASDFEPIE